MSIENLKERMPAYAKDIKLNLSNITGSNALTKQQLWGAVLTSALASRNDIVIEAVAAEAAEHLSVEAREAAKAAAAVMAMNNIYYRSIHLIEDAELSKMPARLRMNVIGNPGVDKLDFELWSLAASAVNGCGMCLKAHAHEVMGKGATREGMQDVLRIAAVVHAAAAIIEGEAALQESALAAA
jgi:alkyl hydroperoxide reductase subunit D